MTRQVGVPVFAFALRERPQGWERLVACQARDARLFQQSAYPGEDRERWAERLAEAQRLCWSCPVARQCLQKALEDGSWGEIRGGYALTEDGRALCPSDLRYRSRRDDLDLAEPDDADEEEVA